MKLISSAAISRQYDIFASPKVTAELLPPLARSPSPDGGGLKRASSSPKGGSEKLRFSCSRRRLLSPHGGRGKCICAGRGQKSAVSIVNSAKNRTVYTICRYVQELASEFHSFYNATRVITDDKQTTLARLSLVWAVKSVLEQGLGILAVTAPEHM